MDCAQERFIPVWQCHQLRSGYLANGPLPRVSHQSRLRLMIDSLPAVHGAIGCGQRKLYASVTVLSVPDRFLRRWSFARVPHQSHLSANDKGNSLPGDEDLFI
jgi:hypothetical protein